MSNYATLVGSKTKGMTTGEHHGHPSPHSPCTLTGTVTEGTSKLRSNGVWHSLQGMSIAEDDCCGAGTGRLGGVPNRLRVNGIPVQAVGDATIPHNGNALVVTGSSKIKT